MLRVVRLEVSSRKQALSINYNMKIEVLLKFISCVNKCFHTNRAVLILYFKF